jgi:hypothetical protein
VRWTGRVAALLLAAAAGAAPLAAQRPATPGDSLEVALVTIGPGQEVWEKFGHNAIVVFDRATGDAQAYDWGRFDFRQESFILRFVQGRMWYSMGDTDAQRVLDYYTRMDRSVWLQELALAPAQKAALRDFLVWNWRPENREYHYDYYRDNCSTRVRDALDRALGGALKARFDGVPTGTTYRWHTARLTSGSPLLYTGLMLGLGHPTDRPISQWEEMFLPVPLMEDLKTVSVTDGTGRDVPLVRMTEQVHRSSRWPEPARPRSLVLPFLLAGALLGSLLWILGRSESRAGWKAFALLGAAWSLVAGLGGLILAGLRQREPAAALAALPGPRGAAAAGGARPPARGTRGGGAGPDRGGRRGPRHPHRSLADPAAAQPRAPRPHPAAARRGPRGRGGDRRDRGSALTSTRFPSR